MQYEIVKIWVSPQVDFPKVLRWTSRDFVARGWPLRGQTRLAPLAKRSTCSKSSPQEQTNDPVVDLWKNMKRQIDLYCPGGGGRRVLPYLAHVYGYVPLNRLWVLSLLKTGYTISLLSVLNGMSFWTGSLSKSLKTCDEVSTFAIPIIFFLNIYFHDFNAKNY